MPIRWKGQFKTYVEQEKIRGLAGIHPGVEEI
jgi:hypothetical protein